MVKGRLIEPGHWVFGEYHAMHIGPGEWQLTKEINLGCRTWIATKQTLRECLKDHRRGDGMIVGGETSEELEREIARLNRENSAKQQRINRAVRDLDHTIATQNHATRDDLLNDLREIQSDLRSES